jgi:nicotinate phosphoribosyltransferase
MGDPIGTRANPSDTGLLSPAQVSLLVDLYELTMSASYLRVGMNDHAVFELFPRRLPPGRQWLLAAGLGPTLELVSALRFGESEVQYLRSLGRFGDDFLDYLGSFRFSGDIHAIPEGTACFANEPLVRVSAPLI